MQTRAREVARDPLADPALAAVGPRPFERRIEIGAEPGLGRRQHERPPAGVHGERPAARRHGARNEPRPRRVDAQPADVDAADPHARRQVVAVRLVIDVGRGQRAGHENEQDAADEERRANPVPAPRRETAALANRRAHAIRVPHRAPCRRDWPARAI